MRFNNGENYITDVLTSLSGILGKVQCSQRTVNGCLYFNERTVIKPFKIYHLQLIKENKKSLIIAKTYS